MTYTYDSQFISYVPHVSLNAYSILSHIPEPLHYLVLIKKKVQIHLLDNITMWLIFYFDIFSRTQDLVICKFFFRLVLMENKYIFAVHM